MNYYPYLMIPAVAWIVAQLLKFSWSAFRGNLDGRKLYASGGMPSSHAAVVCALAATILLLDGAASVAFGVAAVFGAIVMYDAVGVRRSSGQQAIVLNALLDNLGRGKVLPLANQGPLREILGHEPHEVLAGGALGIVLAGLFNSDRITGLTSYLTAPPNRAALMVFAGLSLLLVVIGLGGWLWLRLARSRSAAWRQFSSKVLVRMETAGWIGLLMGFFAYERAAYLSWVLWLWLILVTQVAVIISLVVAARRELPPRLANEAERRRLDKWLTPKAKKKRK